MGHKSKCQSGPEQQKVLQRRCELSKGLVSRARMLYANSASNREPERARASKREPERAGEQARESQREPEIARESQRETERDRESLYRRLA